MLTCSSRDHRGFGDDDDEPHQHPPDHRPWQRQRGILAHHSASRRPRYFADLEWHNGRLACANGVTEILQRERCDSRGCRSADHEVSGVSNR